MVGPTENTRSLTSDSLRSGRVSNPVPSEYKPEVRSAPELLRRASQQSWSVDTRQFAKAVVTLVTVCEQKGLQVILQACQGAGLAQSVQWLCYERWFDCRHRQPFFSSVRSLPTVRAIATGGTSPGVKVTTHPFWCGD